MTHLQLHLSPPRSQVSMMMVMMVMMMVVVVEMVAHIRVAQHALGPITAIASIRGHCGRPGFRLETQVIRAMGIGQ